MVSTHSRLKAAGVAAPLNKQDSNCFNTQPPKGGWKSTIRRRLPRMCFNTQPPKGGWRDHSQTDGYDGVSTHSRLKAAGALRITNTRENRFQHTAA